MGNCIEQGNLRMPLGAVTPSGWYVRALRRQAEGITGRIEEMWDSLSGNSAWLGGNGESWERGPYYLDGLIPLAFLTGDRKLLDKAEKWAAAFVAGAKPDGRFGPENGDDVWSRTVMLKSMLQYVEATGSREVEAVISGYMKYLWKTLRDRPLESYARYRGADLLYSIRWLYGRCRETYLEELHELVSSQLYDWCGDFTEFPFTRPTGYYYPWRGGMERFGYEELPKLMRYHETHCVNIAMGLKLPGELYQGERKEYYREAFAHGMENLMRYHGTAQGIFTGDEHLAGNNPTQGTELCEVVELLFSLYSALEAFGDYRIADHIEKVAYNALPAQFSPDGSRHQYLQQANQVMVSTAPRNWYNNAPDSNLFGLEPNYGCCTANQHQGWPKLAQNFFLRLPGEEGIAAAVYAPCSLRYQDVVIEEETAYPFEEDIRFRFDCDSPREFTFRLRVPQWCSLAVCTTPDGVREWSSGWHDIRRSWKRGDSITLHLSMQPEISLWYHGSASVSLGALVFARSVKGEWKRTEGKERFPDYEVLPLEDWNYAISTDTQGMEVTRSLTDKIDLDPAKPPVSIQVWAKKLEDWMLESASAGDLPVSPVESRTPWERIELVPYGMTTLRIAQFPWLAASDYEAGNGGESV